VAGGGGVVAAVVVFYAHLPPFLPDASAHTLGSHKDRVHSTIYKELSCESDWWATARVDGSFMRR
jgi:hypothetical protein